MTGVSCKGRPSEACDIVSAPRRLQIRNAYYFELDCAAIRALNDATAEALARAPE